MLQRQEGGDMGDLRTSRDQGDGNKARHHEDGWRCGWKGDGAENTGTLTTLTVLHIITLKPPAQAHQTRGCRQPSGVY